MWGEGAASRRVMSSILEPGYFGSPSTIANLAQRQSAHFSGLRFTRCNVQDELDNLPNSALILILC